MREDLKLKDNLINELKKENTVEGLWNKFTEMFDSVDNSPSDIYLTDFYAE